MRRGNSSRSAACRFHFQCYCLSSLPSSLS
ncbi:MAG: DUF3709 domain-containing protein [Bacteroidales bacterium]|nr:DUF3709 domain-containing protein [Candidatus Cacconaster scatequi]